MATVNTFEKTASEKLDFKFSFAPISSGDTEDPEIEDCLESEETISDFNLTASLIGASGSVLTLSGSALADSDKSILFWAEGGVVYGDNYVAALITTTSGRKIERTMKIKVVQRKEN